MKKLKNIKDFLSRDEMRQIQGGSGSGGGCGSMFQSCFGWTCCAGLRCSMLEGTPSFCVTA